MQSYTLILSHQQAAFFRLNAENQWQSVPIDGEESNLCETQADLSELLEKCQRRINLPNFNDIEFTFFFTPDAQSLTVTVVEQLQKFQCHHWQVLNLEPLQKIAGNEPLAMLDWWFSLQNGVDLLNEQKKQLEEQFNEQKKQLEEQLNAQKAKAETEFNQQVAEQQKNLANLDNKEQILYTEIERLKQQSIALQAPSIETLLTFMPVIYRNFWNSVQPADLAFLAGKFTIPTIPNPYPEPSQQALILKAKQLAALPENERNQLRDFCHSLSGLNLIVRPQMQHFLE